MEVMRWKGRNIVVESIYRYLKYCNKSGYYDFNYVK